MKEQVVVEGEKGAPPPLPPYVTVIKDLYKGALALIPFFIMALYTSKQELLQNVNVNIKAAHNPKVYQIGLGIQSNGEFSIAFEVIAGKKIRFLHHKDAEISTGQVKPVFIPENSFITSMVGPFKHLIWKREEPYTNCNIVVEDVGNPALQDGPQTTYIKISDYEGFYIIHIDPTATPDIGVVANHVVKPAASRWSSFKAVTVPVSDPISTKEEHRRQVIPLPFADHPSDKRDYFLSISQWISP